MHPAAATLAALAVAAGLLAGCDSAIPTSGRTSPRVSGLASEEPIPTDAIVGQLLGTWRRSPIVLDDPHVAIFSDACAARARVDLGAHVADLPTALVDAQGMAFAIVILSDDVGGAVCHLDIGPSGTDAIASTIDWVAGPAISPVERKDMSVVSYLHATDGGRTIAFGRIGPEAVKAKITFDDATVIQAATDNGWWATWWRGAVPAATFVATDSKDIVIGHAEKPPEAVDTGVSMGHWWIDPAKPAPNATSTTIHALVTESTCSNGQPPAGRVEQPIIEITETTITVTFRVRRPQGLSQTCQGAPPAAVELLLPEPVGDRKLLDGGEDPPRDATTRAP